jgi:hypothetical protein
METAEEFEKLQAVFRQVEEYTFVCPDFNVFLKDQLKEMATGTLSVFSFCDFCSRSPQFGTQLTLIFYKVHHRWPFFMK